MSQAIVLDRRSRYRVTITLLALLGFALRLHRLDFQPLWGDEGWSFYFAAFSLPELLAQTARDIHPPLYYLLLKGWLAWLGNGPETARLLSVATGTLLIPLTYAAAARLSDRLAGVAAAATVTVAPFAVYYAQEVRMYSLVTLLGLASVYFFQRSLAGDRRSRLVYVAVTAAALYTMYYAVFIPLFQAFYLLGRYRRALFRRPAFRALLAAGGLYLPWIVYAAFPLVTYVGGKRIADADAPLDPLTFLARHVVAFSLGHLPETLLPYAWVALAFAGVAGLGLRAWPAGRRGLIGLYLAAPLAGGWLINLFYPFNPRFFERTLMLAAPAWWLLVGAGLVWIWRRQYLLLGTAAGLLLLLSSIGLLAFYNTPRYPDEDYRPLLAEIAAVAAPEDTLLASYEWQLGLYRAYLPEPQPALYPAPGWGADWADDPARMRRDLAAILDGSPRLWFPAYQQLGHIWEDQAEAALSELAYPAALDWFGTRTTKVTLAGAPRPPLPEAAGSLNFGGKVMASGIRVGAGPYPSGRGVIPVDVTWRKLATLGSDERVNLRLVDAAGRTWASRDSHPRAGQRHLVDLKIGESLADRHGLWLPAGIPPGRYQLRLSLRRDDASGAPLDLVDEAGQPLGPEATLAEIEVVPPEPPLGVAALPVQVERPAAFEGRVRLLGYSLGDGPLKPGDTLDLSLFWQALVDAPGDLTVFAQLQDETGQPRALVERPPVYPALSWSQGTLLRDPIELLLPATIPPGAYRLAVGLLEPDKRRLLTAQRADQVVLQTVVVEGRPHLFEPPSPQYPLAVRFGPPGEAQLAGYDLSATEAHPGDSLTLTLYWQPLEIFQRSWAVFAHLLDEGGNFAGQRDQLPGDGQFPTTSWLPGEYIVDRREIPIDGAAPPGRYLLEVGLYDPVTLERLPVSTAEGQPLGDRLLLETTPVVVR